MLKMLKLKYYGIMTNLYTDYQIITMATQQWSLDTPNSYCVRLTRRVGRVNTRFASLAKTKRSYETYEELPSTTDNLYKYKKFSWKLLFSLWQLTCKLKIQINHDRESFLTASRQLSVKWGVFFHISTDTPKTIKMNQNISTQHKRRPKATSRNNNHMHWTWKIMEVKNHLENINALFIITSRHRRRTIDTLQFF